MSVTDEQILASYSRTASVWKTGEELGLSGQTVHRKLQKLGANKQMNCFTPREEKRLREEYVLYRDAGKLKLLAEDMGRTVPFLSRQARKLGLTTDRASIKHSGKFSKLPDALLRELVLECARSNKTIGEWCATKGFSEGGFRSAAKSRCPKEWDALSEEKRSRVHNYRRGRDFEYATKRDLEKHGFTCLRSPASKSPADLFAVKNGRVAFIQCKNHGAITIEEWNTFFDFCVNAGAVPILSQKQPTGRGILYHVITGKKTVKRVKPYPQEEINLNSFDLEVWIDGIK